ncbi:MAG TPA: hypothetical protein VLD37_03835 [Candidatus Bilamarchaeum sp.]|nr:hypothetical protein [Candidatus Bilamarchaeum sp.]
MKVFCPGDPERNREIVRLREGGLRFRQVAEKVGLKAGYAREIYWLMKDAEKFLERPESLDPLSVRAVKLLSGIGIKSAADLSRLISSDSHWRQTLGEKCGPACANEIEAFAEKSGLGAKC